ncbi:MAG: PstS family phosphate ABC transporter substrate-binding protein [Candidatus Bipolaricaulia bacterium]
MTIKRLIGFSLAVLIALSVLTSTTFAGNILRIDGSSTVYPIANLAAAYWNSNPPVSASSGYWPAEDYGIVTEKNLANYWAGLYGLERFKVQVGLSHSGVGLRKLARKNVDIGNSSAAARFEYPERTEEELNDYIAHIVGYDRQAFSVSEEIYRAGCTVLRKGEIIGIFKGRITNWKEVDSCDYDKEIQVVGRTVGSGTETMFRVNVFGEAKVAGLDGVDIRQGQNQMVKQTLVRSDNAIGYPGVNFISDGNPAIKVIWDDGNTYSIEDQGWPLGRPLYMYTWKGTSKREAAFLRMILSDFGQDVFVSKGTDYFKLSEKDQAEQLEKLPDVG